MTQIVRGRTAQPAARPDQPRAARQGQERLGGALDGLLGKLFANNYVWSSVGLVLAVADHHCRAVRSAAPTGHPCFVLLHDPICGVPLMMGGAALAYRMAARSARARLVQSPASSWRAGGGRRVGLHLGRTARARQPGVDRRDPGMGALAGVGFRLLKAPSRTGRRIMDQIEGFREYLSVAEEDRLNSLNPPEKTPELFERFLPYAVALDCENTWAAKFAGVLAAAGAAAAARPGIRRTATCRAIRCRSPITSAASLSQTIASSSTPPGSSSERRRRQQRRRLVRRRRGWRRRRRLVSGSSFRLRLARRKQERESGEAVLMAVMRSR